MDTPERDDLSEYAPIEVLLQECDLDEIEDGVSEDALIHRLRRAASRAVELDALERTALRDTLVRKLSAIGWKSPARVVDEAFKLDDDQGESADSDPEPWPDPVEGRELLDALASWISEYVHLPPFADRAIAVWAVATWFVDEVYFAPILVLLSPTKRCGKTLALDLLRHVVRRAVPTSGVGVTPAVVFRLNERQHPTFLVDEAERLSNQDAGRDLITMLNVGHRRGQRVLRCADRDSDHDVRDFDAFGFRVLAAIGSLWDTVLDRAIPIMMERRPRTAQLRRFSGRSVEQEGRVLARRIRRLWEDHRGNVGQAEETAPRPEWMGDRECDNWAPLFAVAAIAGEPWPDRAMEAAKALRIGVADEGDHGESLVRDIQLTFRDQGSPEVIKSGELVHHLNVLETSPWGDYRRGGGITPQKLAAMLKPFGVRPRQRRTEQGEKVRGYWLEDFEDVFTRYPLP